MQDIRLVRYYKPRFVTSTAGIVEQRDYTRSELQILVKTKEGKEWQALPSVDLPE
jgi:hypothetical protein